MDKYSYFQCFKCKEPYYGGNRVCEVAAEQGGEGGEEENELQEEEGDGVAGGGGGGRPIGRREEDLICMDCSTVNHVIRCSKPEHSEFQVLDDLLSLHVFTYKLLMYTHCCFVNTAVVEVQVLLWDSCLVLFWNHALL